MWFYVYFIHLINIWGPSISQALYQSPAIHLWVRYMDPQPSGSLYFCRKDRKEISTQVNNIIKYFHEPWRKSAQSNWSWQLSVCLCVCACPCVFVCMYMYGCVLCVHVYVVDPWTMRRLGALTSATVRNLHITFDYPRS